MEELTYEQFLNRMEDSYAEKAGFVPEPASDLGIRLRVLAGELYNLQSGMLWLKRQTFPQTATGELLALHAAQRGITRQSETPSTGTLTFSRSKSLNYGLPIPKGTICALDGEESIRFITTEEGELASGTFSVTIPAVSESCGNQMNVASNTVTRMITPPPGIESVTNEVAFTGGSDQENDESLRQRLLYQFRNLSNGTNRGFYTTFAMGYDGVAYANTVARTDENDSVTVYLCGKDGSVPSALKQQIQEDLSAIKEVNVTVSVEDAVDRKISFSCYAQPAVPYTLTEVSEVCESIFRTYLAELPIGGTFVAMQVLHRLMNTGMVTNCKLYSSTKDVALEVNERAKFGGLAMAELT
ncbi:MAG: baseplate J/gp47 family protein [Oscillospiraceae bacterium]|nr:baseplate J/gp47 family protein [Oscillospiraceae bacterium]